MSFDEERKSDERREWEVLTRHLSMEVTSRSDSMYWSSSLWDRTRGMRLGGERIWRQAVEEKFVQGMGWVVEMVDFRRG